MFLRGQILTTFYINIFVCISEDYYCSDVLKHQVVLPQQLETFLDTTMHQRTFLAATRSCLSPWSMTTWIIRVMELSFIIGTLATFSDVLNTEVMALMYLTVKQSSSSTIGTHWRCESCGGDTFVRWPGPTDGQSRVVTCPRRWSPFIQWWEQSSTMFVSIVAWLQGAPV